MKGLRPYQVRAVEAVEGAWASGTQRPAGVAGTGAGKTQIFSTVAHRFIEADRGGVLVFAHRTELVQQAANRLRRVAPGLGVGIVQGRFNQVRMPVVVGSVQTLSANGCARVRALRNIRLIIIDECHRAAAPSYVSVLEALGAFDPDSGVVALGVTATMSRSDTKALGDVWQDVVFNVPVTDLITDGWLVRPQGIRVDVSDLDLSKVRKSAGDFQAGALGDAMADSMAPDKIAEACREHSEYRSGIVFTPTVNFAHIVDEAMRGAGFTSRVVHGKTPGAERAAAQAGFSAGDVQWLVNCGIFTEGTDLPRCKTVVIGRPTQSRGLYAQMVGRGLRLWCPDDDEHPKLPIAPAPPCPRCASDALVLDVVGVTERHSLHQHIDLFGEDAAEPLGDDVEGEDVTGELAELLDVELDGAPVDIVPSFRTGHLVHRTVDLFAESSERWERTGRGIWYLVLPTRYVAVVPGAQRGTFAVWAVPVAGMVQMVAPEVHGLPGAMKVAEGAVRFEERRTLAGWSADLLGQHRAYASWRIDQIAEHVPHVAATMR